MKSKEEILKEKQSFVAKKYGIGSSLVIGHRPTYYNEASYLAMEEYAEQLLLNYHKSRLKEC